MSKLYKKQIKELEQFLKESPEIIVDVEDLPYQVYERLQQIHNYETLYQDVNRRIWDFHNDK